MNKLQKILLSVSISAFVGGVIGFAYHGKKAKELSPPDRNYHENINHHRNRGLFYMIVMASSPILPLVPSFRKNTNPYNKT